MFVSALLLRISSNSTNNKAPSQRECHSFTQVGKKLFLFGGNDQNKKFNDLHVLDTGNYRIFIACDV